MNTDRIQELLVKGSALTPQDKEDVRDMVAESGLKINLRSGCPDCWKDAVIQLAVHYGAMQRRDVWRTVSGNYECLRRGTWVIGCTRYLLDERTTDDVIERLYAINPLWAGKYFKRVEKVAETAEKTAKAGDNETPQPKKSKKKKKQAQ